MNTKFFMCFLFLLLHLTSCHYILVLKLVLSGAEMVDKFFWKCTLCSFNGTFGVVDTIGQHVRGATHVLVKKNKAAIGTIGIQMTFQDSFTKGVLVGKAKYPPYIPKIIDIPHNDLVS